MLKIQSNKSLSLSIFHNSIFPCDTHTQRLQKKTLGHLGIISSNCWSGSGTTPRQEFILKVWRKHGLGTRLWIALIPPWHFWSRNLGWLGEDMDIHRISMNILAGWLVFSSESHSKKWCMSWVDTFCRVLSWRVWWLADLGCPHLPVDCHGIFSS